MPDKRNETEKPGIYLSPHNPRRGDVLIDSSDFAAAIKWKKKTFDAYASWTRNIVYKVT